MNASSSTLDDHVHFSSTVMTFIRIAVSTPQRTQIKKNEERNSQVDENSDPQAAKLDDPPAAAASEVKASAAR